MRIRTLLVSTIALAGLALAGSQALSQEKPVNDKPGKEKLPFSADPRDHDMQEANQRWMATFKAGPQHKELERFIGEWDFEMKYTMEGMTGLPPSPGKAKTRWLFPGKWIITETSTSVMGQPMDMATIMGYDNFKRKYVVVTLNSMETELKTFQGNFGMEKNALFMFGTIHEAMTGEVEKPVRYVTRIKSADEHVMEIHDPSIGDGNTQVMNFKYTRKK